MLVVDDDPQLRALLRTSFELADIEVDEAESVMAAAHKIASCQPDVIVLDVAMPGTDGITFCRGLKADAFTRDIPVILLTGDSISESTGRGAGADAFLRKPFSPLELLGAKKSSKTGQASFVLRLRPKAFGKRLVLVATAKTPTAKAAKRTSIRLPQRAHR